VRRIVVFVFVLLFFVSSVSPRVFAGQPLSTDDTGTVEPKHLQVEMEAEYLKDNANYKETAISTTFTTGVVWDRLDFALGVPYIWTNPSDADSENGFSDLETRLKLRFFDETDCIPSLAFTIGLKADTGDCSKGLGSGSVDFMGNFIATKCFGKFTVHGNVGYDKTGDLPEEIIYDFINLGLAGEYSLTEKFVLLCEVYAEIATENESEQNPVDVLIGCKYILPCETTLDAGVAFGLTDGAPDYRILAGFTHTF